MLSTKNFAYLALANIVCILHFLLILLVLFGWVHDRSFWFFVSAILITAFSELLLGKCILTVWEFNLRRKVDPSKIYDPSCIMHYSRKLIGLGPRVINVNTKVPFYKNYFLLSLVVWLIIGTYLHFYKMI